MKIFSVKKKKQKNPKETKNIYLSKIKHENVFNDTSQTQSQSAIFILYHPNNDNPRNHS